MLDGFTITNGTGIFTNYTSYCMAVELFAILLADYY